MTSNPYLHQLLVSFFHINLSTSCYNFFEPDFNWFISFICPLYSMTVCHSLSQSLKRNHPHKILFRNMLMFTSHVTTLIKTENTSGDKLISVVLQHIFQTHQTNLFQLVFCCSSQCFWNSIPSHCPLHDLCRISC